MIEITVDETRIRVEGHAGFGPPGRDIVCAGVSALFQTLIWSIEDVAGDIIEYGLGEGNSFLKLEKCVSEECDLLIRSFFIGINAIQQMYPDFIRLIWIGKDKSNGLGTKSEWSGAERMEK